jgi:hypothetical protein
MNMIFGLDVVYRLVQVNLIKNKINSISDDSTKLGEAIQTKFGCHDHNDCRGMWINYWAKSPTRQKNDV